MRDLFSLDQDGAVVILPQAWLIEAFRNVRDKYKEPGIATIELGLVYFAADFRSDFSSGEPLPDRIAQIKSEMYTNRNIKVDKITYAAIKYYEEHRDTTKIKLIKSVTNALHRSIDTINTAAVTDLKEIKDLSDIIAKLPNMLETLEALEKFVKKEKEMESGVVGTGEKSMYEDD